MKEAAIQAEAESFNGQGNKTPTTRIGLGVAIVAVLVAGALVFGSRLFSGPSVSASTPPPPAVAVGLPVQRVLGARLQFLGQFSPVNQVEFRAQVGGTLTQIGFKDGDIVHKGALLFTIDPTPYQIKLSEGNAQIESARARLDLATRELTRSQTLQRTDAGTIENVDQRSAEQRTAQAALDEAEATVRDARFDLDHCRIIAPFTGRIGSHLVSVGNLVSGSRGGGSSTTLLAILVSLSPIYLNFDMSEADYMNFLRKQKMNRKDASNKVEVSLSDETSFSHQGTLDFLDNSLDRSSGTIHARAIVPNGDLLITPGGFARVRLGVSKPTPTLLVPDSAILVDQSDHIVMTVGRDSVVTAKKVQLGDIRYGLRVIRSGLQPSDHVIVDGLSSVTAGEKVTPKNGSISLAPDEEQK